MISYFKSRLLVASIFLLLVSPACTIPASSGPDGVRPELLTMDEAMSGPAEVLSVPDLDKSTYCGPDGWTTFPFFAQGDPNIVSFEQNGRGVTVGVWEDDPELYSLALEGINERLHGLYCLSRAEYVAKSSNGGVDYRADDWRVYPLDFGEGTAAFRAVTWRIKDGPAPSTPVPGENSLIYSTARAYGIVDRKFVVVAINSTAPEPPSEKELRVLWDAQVAKVRFHDAVVRNHEVQSSQSTSVDAPVSR